MQNGFIFLHRALLDSRVFSDEKMLKVWIWILLKANYQPTTEYVKGQKISLDVGEFFINTTNAADELGLSRSTFHRILHILKDETQISLNVKRNGTLVKVLNWGIYQTPTLATRNANETQSETQMKRSTYINNKYNNKNNKICSFGAYDSGEFGSMLAAIDEEA